MSLRIQPNPSIFDENVHVLVNALQPHEEITIYAYVQINEDCRYETYAHYKASENGSVDLLKDPCLGGSYSGIEPMGLFWSLKGFAENQTKFARFVKRGYPEPVVYCINVYHGIASDVESLHEAVNTQSHKPLAAAKAIRMYVAPGVKRVAVRDKGLVGTLFIPRGKGPFPGVINLFGGFPGVLEFKSALHAANGIASLTLAYYGVEGLTPRVDDRQDLAYFEKGVQYLKHHPDVDGRNGIGVVSICKGSMLALAMASCLKDIKCVIWSNNTINAMYGDIVYKEQCFLDGGVQLAPTNSGDPVELHSTFIQHVAGDNAIADIVEGMDEAQSLFPFHTQHHVSYLFLASLDDRCCPSALTIEMAEHLLKKSGHPDYQLVKYEGAGHLLEPPFSPHTVSYYQPGKPFNMLLSCGGDMVRHCKAQEDAWKRALDFLKDKLTAPHSKL